MMLPIHFGTLYKVNLGGQKINEEVVDANWLHYRRTTMAELYLAAKDADTQAGLNVDHDFMERYIMDGDYYVATGKDADVLNEGWGSLVYGKNTTLKFDSDTAHKIALKLYLKLVKPKVTLLNTPDIPIPAEWFSKK